MCVMNKRRVARKIPAEIMENAQIKLSEIISMLEPYLVTLSPPERQALGRMKEGSLKFLELSHGLAVEYPDLFPSFMKAAVFGEEFSAVHELAAFSSKINTLRDSISDTEILAGNRALEFAMAFYNTVKIAARRDLPGAKVILEELKPKFPSGRRRQRRNP